MKTISLVFAVIPVLFIAFLATAKNHEVSSKAGSKMALPIVHERRYSMARLIYALVLVLLVATPSLGQQSLVGSYRMISNVLNIEGTITENMGKSPNGYLVITPTRIVFFFTAEKRQFGTSVPDKAALLDTLTAWAGTYRVEGKKLMIKVDVSWVEHWNGKDQIRNWELSGNRLTITADPFPYPRDPSKKVIPQQEWEKVE